jgi:enoyl-CoA hydratase
METLELIIPRPYVAVVTLNRPPVNALNRQARLELIGMMDELGERDDVRCVVLTAKGKVFCAGADIKEKGQLSDTNASQNAANRITRDVFFSVLDSPKPVIGAINGHALGAGLVLASCCDVLLASQDATFAMPEIDVGQGGGASFLQHLVPRMLMRKMMLTGARISVEEFHRLGVVDQVLPAEELVASAVKLATVVASKSPLAVRTIREAFTAVEDLSLAEGFKLEQRYTSMLSTSADAEEARKAFFEKRSARF